MPATPRDALVLICDERLILARELLVSVEPDVYEETEVAWEKEIGLRIHRFDAGVSQPIPAADVFARLAVIAPGG